MTAPSADPPSPSRPSLRVGSSTSVKPVVPVSETQTPRLCTATQSLAASVAAPTGGAHHTSVTTRSFWNGSALTLVQLAVPVRTYRPTLVAAATMSLFFGFTASRYTPPPAIPS